MTARCARTFDDDLLTGYVDGVLTQSDDQRVRIHLEDCPDCRTAAEELKAMRALTMASTFKMPDDQQWSEAPKNVASAASFRTGWVLLIVAITVWATVALGMFLFSDAPIIVKLITIAGLGGVALLFGSALLDRLSTLKTDRYRGVRK